MAALAITTSPALTFAGGRKGSKLQVQHSADPAFPTAGRTQQERTLAADGDVLWPLDPGATGSWRARLGTSGAWSEAVTIAPPAPALPPAPSAPRLQVGQNVSSIRDYSGDYVFLDRMKASRPWEVNGPPFALDAESWPVSLAGGGSSSARCVVQGHASSEQVATRRFVLLHDGVPGTDFGFDLAREISRTPGRILFEQITDVSFFYVGMGWADRAPRCRVVREDHEHLLVAGEVFSPPFLARCRALPGPLRLMKWCDPVNPRRVAWADRTLPGHATYNGAEGGSQVPYEVQVQLANLAGRDLWTCVPIAADDDFVERLVALLLGSLRPELRLHLEWTNEPWEWTAGGGAWCQALGQRMDPGFGEPEGDGYRMAQVMRVADRAARALGQRARLRTKFSIQTGWLAKSDQVEAGALWKGSATMPGTGVSRLADVFDDVIGTNYSDGDFVGPRTDADRALLLAWARSNDYASALRQWRSGGLLSAPTDRPSGTLPGTLALVVAAATWARARGLGFDFYEGGWGGEITTVQGYSPSEGGEVWSFIGRLLLRPETQALFADLYRGSRDAGAGAMCHFNTTDSVPWWGALPYTEAPDTPRWQALVAAGVGAAATAAAA